MERSTTFTPPSVLAEKILLGILAAGLVLGPLVYFADSDAYDGWLSAEDGPLEWITAFTLFLASVVCFFRAFMFRKKGKRFILIALLGGLVLFFGAGEEISWGQRIFGWSSGDFWVSNNDQEETNLHNLMVGEVKINRVLFGTVLTTVFVLYFVVLPFMAGRSRRVANISDSWFIPVPRPRHSLAFVIALVVMSVLPSHRAPELGEFALSLLLAAVVVRPRNQDAIL